MALQKKYYYTFVRLNTTEIHTVELWQDTAAVLVAEEVTAMRNPFLVELPDMDHKFQVVRGTGCEINMLSETDMKFFDGLYHVDPQEFQVRHYIGAALNWVGYLNAEMYRESYDKATNYPIQVTGNDGFALMDRFSFLDTGDVNFTGVKSKWEILQICLNKIALPWVEVRVSLATTFTGYSAAAASTILHESYIDSANFYDEDDKPMTLREVMESILAPYGACIRAENGNILITDIHTLAGGGSITYKRYNASTYAYIAAIVVSNEKAVSTVQYHGTGQSVETSGGKNRQVVSYSPYPVKDILPESLIGFDEFGTVPATWSVKDGYNYKTLSANAYWDVFTPATFEASYYDATDNPNIYIRWPYLATNQKVASLKLNPFLVLQSVPWITTGDEWRKYAAIKIDGKILIKTKNNPYVSGDSAFDFFSTSLRLKVKIGADYAEYPFGFSADSTNFQRVFTSDSDNISDKFVEMNVSQRGFTALATDLLQGYLSGNLEIEIWSDVYNNLPAGESLTSSFQEIWLTELSVKIIRNDGTEILDTDIEYIGNLDKTFQNEGEKIELTTGTDTYFTDRGRIMRTFDGGSTYSYVTQWTRAAQTFKIEELLLGSLSSNYRAGYVTLSNMKLKNNFDFQNVLTDTFISGKKMMVKSATRNYHDDVTECELIEISTDELIIVK